MRKVPENRKDYDHVFFVTFSLSVSLPLFADDKNAQTVLDAWDFYRARKEIELFGFVVMPNHIHLILAVVPPLTLSSWTNRFKSYVAHQIGRGPIWTSSCWSEVVTSGKPFRQKLNYIHQNPVKAGLVDKPEAYAWSSARDYAVENGPRRIDM